MIRLETLDTVIYHEKEEKIAVSFDDFDRLSDFRYAEYLSQLRYEQNYEVLIETDSIFDIAELLMEAIDDPDEMLKAVNIISEDKFIGLLIYFRDYESLFSETLYLRLDNMEKTKQNKIKKMLDNVKDG